MSYDKIHGTGFWCLSALVYGTPAYQGDVSWHHTATRHWPSCKFEDHEAVLHWVYVQKSKGHNPSKHHQPAVILVLIDGRTFQTQLSQDCICAPSELAEYLIEGHRTQRFLFFHQRWSWGSTVVRVSRTCWACLYPKLSESPIMFGK